MSKGNQDLDKILKYLNFKNIIQFCAFIVFCFAVIRLYLSINNSFRIFSFDDFGSSLDRRFFDKYGLNIYSKLLNNYGINDENDNIIQSLPTNIGNMESLEELWLQRNQMTSHSD